MSLTCLRVKEETGEINILLTGNDPDSGLLYYDYSINGGKNYSALQGKKSGNAENAEQTENISQDITVSGQETEGLPGETEEAVEASGSVHEINMGWYERKDAEKESEKILVNRSDISQFLWLMILGLLVALLILLIITRSVFRKKQKRARYRGRRR